MNSRELEARTKKFAVGAIRFSATFAKGKAEDVVSFQFVKSATSIGANYREANRAASHNDFIHKISIVEKEASESQYWLELCCEVGMGSRELAENLLKECAELLAIFTSVGRTAKANRQSASEEEAHYQLDETI